eukprot:SAG31_NODE_405_length_16084_cov_3.913982_9_plen_154_part_00
MPTQHLTLELVDTKGSGLGGSKQLEAVLHNFCPHPVRWKQVWYKSEAADPMFIWRAVPPTSKYVALGMVATTTDDAPSRELLRCVPKAWCIDARPRDELRLAWDDSGSGGRPGSLWSSCSSNNSAGTAMVYDGASIEVTTMAGTPGHQPPVRS